MAKNQVQYQKGYSLIELFKDYGGSSVKLHIRASLILANKLFAA